MPSITEPPTGGKGQIRPSPLRLVHPSPPTPSKPRRPPPLRTTFTRDEEARLRAALRNARALFGTWACLADAMYVRAKRIEKAANGAPVSADVAVRLARALGKPLDALLAPLAEAKLCPHCGRFGAP